MAGDCYDTRWGLPVDVDNESCAGGRNARVWDDSVQPPRVKPLEARIYVQPMRAEQVYLLGDYY